MGRRRQIRNQSPEHDLTQAEADLLIGMPKEALDPGIPIPFHDGMNREVGFRNDARGELFRVIIERSAIRAVHAKYQLMARNFIVLLRLDIGGPPHTNPDYEIIPCPHLHRYRENHGDTWAERLPPELGNTNDLVDCLRRFLRYCNVVQVPEIQGQGRLF
jgi:hypothetical protein